MVLCQRELLEGMVPTEILGVLASPEKAAALIGTGWETRLRFLPCESVGGTRMLCGLEPDAFRPEGSDAVPCILALAGQRLSDGEYQAVSGPMEFSAADVPNAGQERKRLCSTERNGRNHV